MDPFSFRISGPLAYTHARRFFGFLPFFSFDYPACEEAGWTISPCMMAFIISVPMIPVRFFHMISVHISLIQQGRFRRGGTPAISCAVREALVLASRARCVRRLRPRCARDTYCGSVLCDNGELRIGSDDMLVVSFLCQINRFFCLRMSVCALPLSIRRRPQPTPAPYPPASSWIPIFCSKNSHFLQK